MKRDLKIGRLEDYSAKKMNGWEINSVMLVSVGLALRLSGGDNYVGTEK
jgi:hypothetical protein